MIGRRLAQYEVVAELGEGGMGVVYQAYDTKLDRSVAIKVLHPERVSDEGRRLRFIKEAKAATTLNHPGIITIYDFINEGGMDAIVMECVQGRTFQQLIGNRKGLSLKKALDQA